jgi:hypothetical protein
MSQACAGVTHVILVLLFTNFLNIFNFYCNLYLFGSFVFLFFNRFFWCMLCAWFSICNLETLVSTFYCTHALPILCLFLTTLYFGSFHFPLIILHQNKFLYFLFNFLLLNPFFLRKTWWENSRDDFPHWWMASLVNPLLLTSSLTLKGIWIEHLLARKWPNVQQHWWQPTEIWGNPIGHFLQPIHSFVHFIISLFNLMYPIIYVFLISFFFCEVHSCGNPSSTFPHSEGGTKDKLDYLGKMLGQIRV